MKKLELLRELERYPVFCNERVSDSLEKTVIGELPEFERVKSSVIQSVERL